MATIQVGVHWTIRHVQAIIAVATKESALIGQLVSKELKKFIYYRATQAIFKKYHSDLYPKLKDNSVTFNAFTKFFEYKSWRNAAENSSTHTDPRLRSSNQENGHGKLR